MVRRRAPSTPLVRGGTMAVVIERFKQWRCIMGVPLIPTVVFLWAFLDSANCSCLVSIGGFYCSILRLSYEKDSWFMGRNPADDWFYIRNTQILWHHRPDRCLQIFVYWHQLTCFSQDHAFRTDHLVSGMYSMSCVFWYNIQVTSIYTTFKTHISYASVFYWMVTTQHGLAAQENMWSESIFMKWMQMTSWWDPSRFKAWQ